MSEQSPCATVAAPEIQPRSLTKWEREAKAFYELLPQLLQTARGKYVAIHEGRVVDSDADEMALTMRVLGRIGNVDIHVGLVSELPEPMIRSGIVRELTSSAAP